MKERLITATKETFYFISSKIFIKNASFAFLGIACFFLLTFQGLKCYTNHGKSVSVPDFKGQTLGQIKAQLHKSNLTIEIVDSIFDADELPLTIMEQTPLPTKKTGLKVKKNRTIYLTVNSVTPPLKTLPSIWDKDETTVARILENNGFRFVEKERRPDKAMNTILEVFYKGKKLNRNEKNRLPANSEVELVIADGGGSEVIVPKVICLPYSEAQFMIEGSNLNILMIDKDGTVTDEGTAYVWKQSPMPEPGRKLTVGEEVSVWLTQSMPPGCSSEIIDTNPTDGETTTNPTPTPTDDNGGGFGDDGDGFGDGDDFEGGKK